MRKRYYYTVPSLLELRFGGVVGGWRTREFRKTKYVLYHSVMNALKKNKVS